jgi:hypothetical protein
MGIVPRNFPVPQVRLPGNYRKKNNGLKPVKSIGYELEASNRE